MSDSSPELLGHRTREERASLSRSASYQNLPETADIGPVSPPLRRTFSDLASPSQAPSPTREDVAAGKDILRRTSLRSQSKDPAIAVTRVADLNQNAEKLDEEDVDSDSHSSESQDAPSITIPETRPPEPVAQPSKARVMSGRLVSFARKPWASSSPSPKPHRTRSSPTEDAPPLEEPPAQPDFKAAVQSETPVDDSDTTQPARKRTMLNKRPRRPVVAVVTQHGHSGSVDSQKSPASMLRPKHSFDKFTASLNISTPVLPPNSKSTATSPMTLASSVEPPRKKDDLWGVFRGLEADNQKFQSKSSALKANVIRSSLIPFLNRHQFHSCKNLRPEDLDRRVNILNKWWSGLLEMLNGKHNQSISGTDRPVYLEAVVGIMTRPEWRIAFPVSHPSDSLPRSLQHTPTSLSDSSDRSSGSDFLLESIHHNIRNIFTQNLLTQMAFVVERMSMRHAPASLVAFCGKACAYAFFFCPGVADSLVRLWSTPASSYQRVFAESGVLDKSSSASRAFAQDLAMSFPAALQPLSFHSHIPLVRYLRQKPDIPVNASQIPWHSPWVSRWCGRDTDLFFVFVKFVHILYADSMPRDIDKKKRILAPGLLPVHAQLLVVLEKTLHKQPGPQGGAADNSHSTAATTFDDFIEGADTVSALPLGAANSHRSMAENRLIILLRDFLSESSVEPNRARLLYAESFCAIVKAAMQKTSLYDHNTCFLICDFMEEVIPIITKYSQSIEMTLFDWPFWLGVCKKMMESHNSVTEVRVFSFIFCMWNTWVASEQRKEDLCLNFLLHESWFYQYYNHWSSMVRSYFHRLLCWRVARLNDEPTPLDSTIYETLSNRLRRIWEYFVASQIKATEEGTAPLSSAPCTPAPGRRIVIIRCDSQVAHNNLFVSFDRVVPPAPPEDSSLSRKSSNGSTSTTDSSSESQNQPKRKWGILKAMFGVSSGSTKSSDSQSSGSSTPDEKEKEIAKPDGISNTEKCVENHPQRPAQTEVARPKTATTTTITPGPHQLFFFKFSLEWTDRPQWPTRNRRLFPPSLPASAQFYLQRLQQSRAGKVESNEPASDSPTATEAETETEETKDEETKNAEYREKFNTTDEQALLSQPSLPTPSFLQPPSPYPVPKAAAYDKVVASKYVGRALAEWAIVVTECDSFFARRRDEGIPVDRLVETPTLGVEFFRK